ncbi:SMG1 [Lepeophtheirus salmonis]|uniref:SMG1 n=1 Tax=Lepeophtheirus salmonis TaxID=72036 RepID=A0A7R8CE38_LEPSM|nr:SMG1 [Lepeophtheirus salmonis]CAF2749774.1 SMG1 [Lepeophtheirus salmonis]
MEVEIPRITSRNFKSYYPQEFLENYLGDQRIATLQLRLSHESLVDVCLVYACQITCSIMYHSNKTYVRQNYHSIMDKMAMIFQSNKSEDVKRETVTGLVRIGEIVRLNSSHNAENFYKFLINGMSNSTSGTYYILALNETLKVRNMDEKQLNGMIEDIKVELEKTESSSKTVDLVELLRTVSIYETKVFVYNFVDIIDILVGCLIDHNKSTLLSYTITKTFIQWSSYWDMNVAFSISLLQSFTEDLEELTEDIVNAQSEQSSQKYMKNIINLLQIFNTILSCIHVINGVVCSNLDAWIDIIYKCLESTLSKYFNETLLICGQRTFLILLKEEGTFKAKYETQIFRLIQAFTLHNFDGLTFRGKDFSLKFIGKVFKYSNSSQQATIVKSVLNVESLVHEVFCNLISSNGSVISKWALDPPIFTVLCAENKVADPSFIMREPMRHLILLRALHAHCHLKDNFIRTSCINAVLVAPSFSSTFYGKILEILRKLFDYNYGTRYLYLRISTWIERTFNTHPEVYTTNSTLFSSLIDSVLRFVYNHHNPKIIRKCLKPLISLINSNACTQEQIDYAYKIICIHISNKDEQIRELCHVLHSKIIPSTTCSNSIELHKDKLIKNLFLSRFMGQVNHIDFRHLIQHLFKTVNDDNKSFNNNRVLRRNFTDSNKGKDTFIKESALYNEELYNFWNACEISWFAIANKLKTPLGKAQDLLTTIEKQIRLQVQSPNVSLSHSLLGFFDIFERMLINSCRGGSAFHYWIKRLRPSLVALASKVNAYDFVIRQCNEALSLEYSSDNISDQENMLIHFSIALFKKGLSYDLKGLYSWCKKNTKIDGRWILALTDLTNYKIESLTKLLKNHKNIDPMIQQVIHDERGQDPLALTKSNSEPRLLIVQAHNKLIEAARIYMEHSHFDIDYCNKLSDVKTSIKKLCQMNLHSRFDCEMLILLKLVLREFNPGSDFELSFLHDIYKWEDSLSLKILVALKDWADLFIRRNGRYPPNIIEKAESLTFKIVNRSRDAQNFPLALEYLDSLLGNGSHDVLEYARCFNFSESFISIKQVRCFQEVAILADSLDKKELSCNLLTGTIMNILKSQSNENFEVSKLVADLMHDLAIFKKISLKDGETVSGQYSISGVNPNCMEIGFLLKNSVSLSPDVAKYWGSFADWAFELGEQILQNEVTSSIKDSEKEALNNFDLAQDVFDKICSLFSNPKLQTKLAKDMTKLEFMEDQVKELCGDDISNLQNILEIWLTIQKRMYFYFELSLFSYFQQISLSTCEDKVIPATLRILHMIVKYSLELEEPLEKGLSVTPCRQWIPIIPQLFSRLNHPIKLVRNKLIELLSRLAKENAQSIIYPAIVGSLTKGKLSNIVDLQEDEDGSPKKNENSDKSMQSAYIQIVNNRISLLWDELWSATLQQYSNDINQRAKKLEKEIVKLRQNDALQGKEIKRLIFEKFNIIFKPLLFVLEKIVKITSVPETQNEINFSKKYQEHINNLIDSLRNPTDPFTPVNLLKQLQEFLLLLLQRPSRKSFGFLEESDQWQQKKLNSNDEKQKNNLQNPSDLYYSKLFPLLREKGINNLDSRKKWPDSVLRDVMESLISETPNDLIASEIYFASYSSKDWYHKINNLTKSIAIMSTIGYIIGLGDRHLDNLLIDFAAGEIIHIDYNNIVKIFGVPGVQGAFKYSCEDVLKSLRGGCDTLINLLEAFVYDPLVDWTPGVDTLLAQNVNDLKHKKDLQTEIMFSMYCVRITEIESAWFDNKYSFIDYLSKMENSLDQWLETDGNQKTLNQDLSDMHVCMSLLKDAESNPRHKLFFSKSNYKEFRDSKQFEALVVEKIENMLADIENQYNLIKRTYSVMCPSQLEKWNNGLNFSLSSSIISNTLEKYVSMKQNIFNKLNKMEENYISSITHCKEELLEAVGLLSNYIQILSPLYSSTKKSHILITALDILNKLSNDLTIDNCIKSRNILSDLYHFNQENVDKVQRVIDALNNSWLNAAKTMIHIELDTNNYDNLIKDFKNDPLYRSEIIYNSLVRFISGTMKIMNDFKNEDDLTHLDEIIVRHNVLCNVDQIGVDISSLGDIGAIKNTKLLLNSINTFKSTTLLSIFFEQCHIFLKDRHAIIDLHKEVESILQESKLETLLDRLRGNEEASMQEGFDAESRFNEYIQIISDKSKYTSQSYGLFVSVNSSLVQIEKFYPCGSNRRMKMICFIERIHGIYQYLSLCIRYSEGFAGDSAEIPSFQAVFSCMNSFFKNIITNYFDIIGLLSLENLKEHLFSRITHEDDSSISDMEESNQLQKVFVALEAHMKHFHTQQRVKAKHDIVKSCNDQLISFQCKEYEELQKLQDSIANPELRQELKKYSKAYDKRAESINSLSYVYKSVISALNAIHLNESLRNWKSEESIEMKTNLFNLLDDCHNLRKSKDKLQGVASQEIKLYSMNEPVNEIDLEWIKATSLIVSDKVKKVQSELVESNEKLCCTQSILEEAQGMFRETFAIHQRLMTDVSVLLQSLSESEDYEIPRVKSYVLTYKEFSSLVSQIAEKCVINESSVEKIIKTIAHLKSCTSIKKDVVLESSFQDKKGEEEKNAFAINVLRRVRSKLEGKEPDPLCQVSVPDQAGLLGSNEDFLMKNQTKNLITDNIDFC